SVAWDLSSTKARARALGEPTSAADLKRVLPGDYVVTMKVAGTTLKQPIRVDARPSDRVGPPR
ncbi:MAG: hypothetical protein ABI322_00075, partial [Gemmatimonadaceae bacterium]